MNYKIMILALIITSCASPQKQSHHDNLLVESHDHTHAKNCGHKRIKHGDHWDYKHGQEYHHVHNTHVDFHGHTDEGRTLASSPLMHKNHDHKHGKDCGHERVKHGNHWDYLHGNHYHHGKDEHGIPSK